MNKLFLVLFISIFSIKNVLAVPINITKDEYGKDWAFNANEVQLQCFYGGAFVFNFDDDEVYAISGLAKVLAKNGKVMAVPIEDSGLWKDNPELPGTKINLSPFIERALKTCRQ